MLCIVFVEQVFYGCLRESDTSHLTSIIKVTVPVTLEEIHHAE